MVDFSDGTAILRETLAVLSPLDFIIQVRRRLKELADVDAVGALPVGPVDTSEPTPTAPQLERDAYGAALTAYRRARNAVDFGIVPPDWPPYLNRKTYLINNFKPEYLNLY